MYDEKTLRDHFVVDDHILYNHALYNRHGLRKNSRQKENI